MRLFIGILISNLLLGCTKNKPDTSFYYWKTVYQLSPEEKAIIKDNEVKTIYIRFFDLQLIGKNPAPLSPIVFKEKPKTEIIPVIYIKNEVMIEPSIDLNDLANKTFTYIQQIAKKNQILFDEVQLDCDWTLTSKDRFLLFVSYFKVISQKRLSATIRLHQIKYYQEIGIPNVEYGVLMYYNMGHIAPDEKNSIYEKETAARYLESLADYPLALNVALPIFSWSVIIRDGKVIDLLSKTNQDNYNNDTHFERTSSFKFCVKEPVIKSGVYFQVGDIVKIESIAKKDIKEMVNDLQHNLKSPPSKVIFYDLDIFNLKPYANDKKFFKKISSGF